MNCNFFDSPYPHVSIEKILTEEENLNLYNICNKLVQENKEEIDSYKFFVLEQDRHLIDEHGMDWCLENGIIQNNEGLNKLFSKDFKHNIRTIYSNISKKLFDVMNQNKSLFPELKTVNGDCSFNCNLVITCDNEKWKALYPHTDWRFDILNDMGYGNLTEDNEETKFISGIGYYKGLIYIGDPNLEYKDYGTRIYKDENRSSEVKEIPFIPGNGMMFKTTKNSYHGTEFKSGYKNYRYTITFEYY